MRSPDRHAVEAAAARASEALWTRQNADGSFDGLNHGGPMYTGLTLVVEAWQGVLTAADAQAGSAWLLAQQRSDGGFSGTPAGETSSVDATWAAIGGLRATAPPGSATAIERAMTWLEGRPPGPFVAPLLALKDPTLAPRLPLAWVAIPAARRLLWSRFNPWMVLAFATMAAIGHGLRPEARRGPFNARVEQAAIEFILRLQNPCGSWAGALLFTLLAVAALQLLGFQDPTDPAPGPLRRARSWMEHWKRRDGSGLEVVPFEADSWNTGRALRALLVAGASPVDPRVIDAVRWLQANQVRQPANREWQNPHPDFPDHGGWAYESTNLLCPDTDTTAAVLSALALVRGAGAPDVAGTIDLGRRWLSGMQNKDGGWPAFRRDVGRKRPGPMFRETMTLPTSTLANIKMFVRPPVEAQEPSTEDLTARIMMALADCGSAPATLARPAGFLRAMQWESRWFGRWDVNYQAGTAYALGALARAGVPPHDEAFARSIRWLEGHQNSDGGWGESIKTYRHPDSGPAPSRADLTGHVLMALLAAGRIDTEPVRRGTTWLLDTQDPDGTWKGPMPLYVVDPPDEFYSNPVASLAAPVEALGRWLEL